MERVIDPLLADIRIEYDEANRRGCVWKSRAILFAGYLAFVKTLALCACDAGVTSFEEWPADDRAALKRTLGVSVAATAVMTVVFEMPPLLNQRVMADPENILFLIPQALVVAVPMGVTVGVFLGLRGRILSLRSRAAVLGGAILLSFACLATVAWILPWANQEFRVTAFRRIAGDQFHGLVKGHNELTLGELRERIAVEQRAGRAGWDPRLVYTYHQRWAL
jgi:hypothetical protein